MKHSLLKSLSFIFSAFLLSFLFSQVTLAQSTFVGSLDSPIQSSNGEVWGWVCNSSTPTTQYYINFYANGSFVGTSLANIQREPAVGNLCGGNPYHGFIWQPPSYLFDGTTKSVLAKVVVNGAEVAYLNTTPKNIFFPKLSEHPNGYVDYFGEDYILGWACSPTSTGVDSNISVYFYSELGFLGSVQPNMSREPGVAAMCGGASRRGFQFSIPPLLKDNKNHTITVIASNASGTVKKIIGNGISTRLYSVTPPATTYASMPNITEGIVDDVIRTVYQSAPPANFVNNFVLAAYCYAGNADGTKITWPVSNYTKFLTGLTSTELAKWQRGLVDSNGQMAMQAKDSTYGVFVNYNASYLNQDCINQQLAGVNITTMWSNTSQFKKVWDNQSLEAKRKELSMRFEFSAPYSNGTAYAGPAFRFWDPTKGYAFWLTIQLFDPRGWDDTPNPFPENPAAPNSLLIITTVIGKDGNYGRTQKGSFTSQTSNSYNEIDFRFNGFHMENALAALGCNGTTISCNASDYYLTIAQIGAEVKNSSQLGLTARNVRLLRTEY
jgi:hypothetical protein